MSMATLSTVFHVVEVLVYYDYARVFTCYFAHDKKNLYLVLNVSMEAEYEEWLFVEILNQNIENLKKGRISLRQAILSGKNPLRVKTYLNRKDIEIVKISMEDITEDDLPDFDSYLVE